MSIYEAYGLKWSIPWAFPRFLSSEPKSEATQPDATARMATVVVRDGEARWPEEADAMGAGPFRRANRDGHVWLKVPGAATFAVRGLEVVVEAEPDSDANLRDLALAGPVASLVVRNASMVPLRGAAVRDGDLAAVILGTSAIGASTLAAALIVRGLQFVGDDLVSLTPRPEKLPLVAGGSNALQLPPDTEAALRGRLGAAGVPPRPGTGLPRLDVPLAGPTEAPALAAVYVLDTEATDEVRLSAITGLARMEAIQAADWHRVLRREQGYDSDDFVAAASVTTGVAMRQVSRLEGPDLHIGELSRVVRRDFRAVCGALRESA